MMKRTVLIFLALLLLLSACNQQETSEPTDEITVDSTSAVPTTAGETPLPQATATPSPTPLPTRDFTDPLVICLGEEPNTLFPFADLNSAAEQVLQAIYDGPIDMVDYQPQPVILQEIPDFDNGLAKISQVTVQEGDLVLDEDLNPVTLSIGTRVFPTGCRSQDCAIAFDGVPLVMDQLSVQFRLLSGLTWSDGMPLTSADSVYGFSLASQPGFAGDTYTIERTASYTAGDNTTVTWIGLPGYLDQDYQTNFWQPAPEHLWGSMAPEELLTSTYSAEAPLGWGPYRVVSWEAGSRISLEFNPYYFRASEGLPYFSELIYKFVGTDTAANIELLNNGECDLLNTSTLVNISPEQLAGLNQSQIHITNTSSWEHLAFNIKPISYDDGFSLAQGDPSDIFGDLRFRQALNHCIDQEALAAEFSFDASAALNSLIPENNPLYPEDLLTYEFDPALGGQLLDEIGWTLWGDGSRVAFGVAGVFDYTPLTLSYYTADDARSLAIAQRIAEQLSGCSIELQITALPQVELLAAGPQGPVFGRTFQVAEFAWTSEATPPCQLFLGEAIPGPDTDIHPYYWTGWNMTGWENAAYDEACTAALQALPSEAAYTRNYQEALRILSEELPILPLFSRTELVLTRADFCSLEHVRSTPVFYDLELFGYGELCE